MVVQHGRVVWEWGDTVTKSNLHLAPSDYERKQTLVNAERFTTPELKELESKILDAEEKMLALEREEGAFTRLASVDISRGSTASRIGSPMITIISSLYRKRTWCSARSNRSATHLS